MRPLNKKIDINTDENFEAIEVPIIIKSSQQLYFRLVSLFSGLFFLNACSLDVSIMDMAQYAAPSILISGPDKSSGDSSTEFIWTGVTPDLLDTVKGSRTPCTRLGSSCQVRSAEQRGYNLQTILAIA